MSKTTSIGNLIEALTTNISAAELKSAMVISDISSRIAIERCNKGLTQKQFAKSMGVTQGMVSKWESGEYNFTIEAIANIFDKLNLDFEFNIVSDNGFQKIIDFENNLKISMPEKINFQFKDDNILSFVG